MTLTMNLKRSGLAVLMLLALLLAACGGGGAPAAEPTTPPAAEPTTPPAAEPTADTGDADTGDADTSDADTDDMDTTEPVTDTGTTDTVTDTGTTDTVTDTGTTDTATGDMQAFVIVPEESLVTYTVDEVFLREGTEYATAVGTTQAVEGTLMYDSANPQQSSISQVTVDISTFETDSERRDNAIRDKWLESATYPMATFQPTSIEGLPETYTEGETISFQITGDLTVREVTNPVTFETTGTLVGNELSGEATTTIMMTDYGFDPPDIAGVLKAENEVLITFTFVARSE